MIVQCCVCKDVRTDDIWADPPSLIEGDISHTYCPDCLVVFQQEIREYHEPKKEEQSNQQGKGK
jgi:hypothetical protein